MFLLNFNKKSILETRLSPTSPQAAPATIAPTPATTEPQQPSVSLKEPEVVLVERARILTHILRSSTLVGAVFKTSWAALRRWLETSVQALLTKVSSILNTRTGHPSTALALTPFIQRGRQNQLAWQEASALPILTSTPASAQFTTHPSYLNALIEARTWSAIVAESLADEELNNNNNTNNNNTSSGISSSGSTRAGSKHSEPQLECDMDWRCSQRKIAQRAAYTEHAGPVSPYHCWEYGTSAAQPLSHHISNDNNNTTRGGLDFENEEAGRLHCREQERQTLMECQGQLRSCGLRTELSGARRESPFVQSAKQQQQQAQPQRGQHNPAPDFKYTTTTTCPASFASSTASLGRASYSEQQHHQEAGHSSAMEFNANFKHERRDNDGTEVLQAPMVLVSKAALSDLTDQIAFSMNKMKHLEEQVRVIPELQRRLDHMISDNVSSSVGGEFSTHQPSSNQRNSRFNTDNTATNNNHQHQLEAHDSNQSRRNSANNNEEVLKSIHPSLQRHYNSFRQYSAANKADRCAASYANNNFDNAARADSLRARSPFPAAGVGAGTTRGSTNLAEHTTSGAGNHHQPQHNHSRQSFNVSSSSNSSMLRSTGESINGSGCSPKVEYEDLINDLISLSYSVNYLSSTNSNSAHSESSSRSQLQKQEVDGKIGNHAHDGASQQSFSSANGNHPSSTSLIQHHHHNHHQNHHQNSNSNNQQHHSATSIGSNSNNNHSNNNRNTGNSVGNNSSRVLSSYFSRTYNRGGSLSLQTTPVKMQLDCGCQSFKEHLRYNTISREQRLNQAKSQSVSSTNNTTASTTTTCNSNVASPQLPQTHKIDASTNTDLSMQDIVTKDELNSMLTSFQKTYSTISSTASCGGKSRQFQSTFRKSSSLGSQSSTSGSVSGPKSSSPHSDTRSNSCDDDNHDNELDDHDKDNDRRSGELEDRDECSPNSNDDEDRLTESKDSHPGSQSSDDVDEDDDEEEEDENGEEEEEEANAGSLNAEGPFSIGSSYQDPSDFEEYCAYEESLDRRTKDFMSQSTKIPHDLRFALIRLNDFIKRKRPFNQMESSSGCIEKIRKQWFEAAATKESQAAKTQLYVDYFESFTKQLLNTVVNLADNAGNTAMHYAASYYKLDIIKVLLSTKVCDVNCRNRAGYTPIMLLALAEIEDREEQDIVRHLFTIGDVNIKARSSGQTALMLAASHGRIGTCKLLLECGADPSLRDYDGSTALMCGSELGNEEVVRCLLAHKLTDPNATDNDGLDALKIAMNNGHKNIGLILYTAKNVPRMTRPSISLNNSNYLGASMRRSRGKLASNYVRRADSLLGSRSNIY